MAELSTRIILRNDSTTNWLTNETKVLLKGEVGIEHLADGTVKFKIGDGTKTWAELPYYEGVFDKDLTLTYAFGKYVPDDTGSVVVPSKGKTMEELLLDAYSVETNPETEMPSITLKNVSEFKAYEVGTKVTPSYSIEFDEGSYTFDASTGATATGYSATFNGETLTTQSGDFAEMTVGTDTNIRMSAYATHGDGVVPTTNLGNEYADGQIKAGNTETKYSGYITGYRSWFIGTVSTKLAETTINSALIRGLANKGNGANASSQSNVTIAGGTTHVIVAIPTTSSKKLKGVTDVDGMGLPIFDEFVLDSTITVEGANGYEADTYNVWVKKSETDAGVAATRYTFTIG